MLHSMVFSVFPIITLKGDRLGSAKQSQQNHFFFVKEA